MTKDDKTFRLSDNFLQKYKWKSPGWGFNGLGEVVYLRTYSRLKENKENERWWETAARVVNGIYNMQKRHIEKYNLGWNPQKAQWSAQDMYNRIFQMKFLPPGRGLQHMGSILTEEKGLFGCLFNCAFISTEALKEDPVYPFCFTMDASMIGIGVGFDTLGAGKVVIKGPNKDLESETYIIPDTREGWVKSVRLLLESYFDNTRSWNFDYSEIRPAGEAIKGFGGVSSGSAPLTELHKSIIGVLERNTGNLISITTIVDIMNLIGRCVVSGNIRRCLPKDTLVHCKNGLIPIQDVIPGTTVYTSDGVATVSELIEQGDQKLIDIHTQLGILSCTGAHKLAVLEAPGKYTWKCAANISSGDRLVFPKHEVEGHLTKLPSWSYQKPTNSTTCVDIAIPELDTDMAWFIGYLQGDGYVYTNEPKNGFNAHISIACPGDEYGMHHKVRSQILRFGTKINEVKPSSKDGSIKIRSQSKQLALYLSQIKKPNEPMRVPDFIMQGRPKIRAAYLAGLFDADGGCKTRPLNAVTSVYHVFLREVQSVYASLGIPTRLKDGTFPSRNDSWQDIFNLNVVGPIAESVFEDKVAEYAIKYRIQTKGLKCSQHDYGYPTEWLKQDKQLMKGFRSRSGTLSCKQIVTSAYDHYSDETTTLIPIEVIKIELTGKVLPTYDISVPGANEFIIQDGLLVHNSALLSLGPCNKDEYLDLKNYDINPYRESFGWSSNNSVVVRPGIDYGPICDRIRRNGEPGLVWLDNMRDYGLMNNGRTREDSRVMGCNPCVTGDTLISTEAGPKQVSELIGKPFRAIVNSEQYECQTGFFSTGVRNVLRIETKEGYHLRVTDNHKVLRANKVTQKKVYSEWVRAGRLRPGDMLVMNNHRDRNEWEGRGTEGEGYLLGLRVGNGYLTNKIRMTSLCSLAGQFGIHKGHKHLDQGVEYTSSKFHIGFIRGMFDVAGSVQGTHSKGVSIRLSQSDLVTLNVIQRMLLRIGIMSTIYQDRREEGYKYLPDGNGELKKYWTRTNHELVISGDNLALFEQNVGFNHTDKANRLRKLLVGYKRRLNRSRFVVRVASIEPDNMERVYDAVVNKAHAFDANGFVVHNCGEATLEGGGELCNLVEVFPSRHDDIEDMKRTLKYAYLYSKTVTLVNTHWPMSNRVMLRNRRIGCSISGLAQFLAKHSVNELKEWMSTGYETIQYYDKVYSDWLAVPRSIKSTVVKPSGSVSLLAGSTPGIHFPMSRFYVRRVRMAKDSDLLGPIRAAGYKVEKATDGGDTTVVVEFPVDAGKSVRTGRDVSMWEQLSLAALAQRYWADQSVSATVQFDPVTEGPCLKQALEYFQYQLKAVTFLPRIPGGAYKQMPYEEIDEDTYNNMISKLKPLRFGRMKDHEIIPDKFCDGDACEI